MYIVLQYVRYIVTIIVIWTVLYGWATYGCHVVNDEHMQPTLKRDAFKTYQKQKTKISDFQRGDLAVYFHHVDPESGEDVHHLTGRIVGLPGDRIKMKSGELFRNGSSAPEPYIEEPGNISFPYITIPRHHVFVLADNRNYRNRDSRFFGPIPEYCILGKIQKE